MFGCFYGLPGILKQRWEGDARTEAGILFSNISKIEVAVWFGLLIVAWGTQICVPRKNDVYCSLGFIDQLPVEYWLIELADF